MYTPRFKAAGHHHALGHEPTAQILDQTKLPCSSWSQEITRPEGFKDGHRCGRKCVRGVGFFGFPFRGALREGTIFGVVERENCDETHTHTCIFTAE